MTALGVRWLVAAAHEIRMKPESMLRAIKAIHTLVWAGFAGSILAIPVFTRLESLRVAWGLNGFVLLEVIVLAVNGMRCPLSDVAGRHTSERQDNFDIYLPLWLARHNKEVFGGLYRAGILYTAWLAVRAATDRVFDREAA